jgi:hypothetical protein
VNATRGTRVLAITTLVLVAVLAVAIAVAIESFDGPRWFSSTGSSVVATKDQFDAYFAAMARGRIALDVAAVAFVGAVTTFAARTRLVRRRDGVS